MHVNLPAIRQAMTPERAEPHMTRHQLRPFGLTHTWSEWVSQCMVLIGRFLRTGPDAKHPRKDRFEEPWVTYWRDGLNAKDAMERVNGRNV